MLKEDGNWTEFRRRFDLEEVDLHFGRRDLGVRYDEVMSDVEDLVRASLANARNAGRPYVMFIGTVEPRKNLPRLLRAFASIPRDDVDLVLVGPAGWNESLDADLARIEGRVHTLGFLDKPDRDALLAGAQVFCLPSLKEGFGLPVLEAMVQGAPVVTSIETSTAEVAGDAALLVDPRDEQAIAHAIEELLEDRVLADQLSTAGRANAALYTWDRTAAATRTVYAEAIE